MNESQKNSKVEMEIQRYEREMMRNARIKNLKDQPLKERVSFVLHDGEKKDWTPEEMHAELNNLGLAENISLEDIEKELNSGMTE